MRQLLFIFTVIISGQMFACGGAYQYRLFPIGACKDKIVVVETSLNRYNTPDIESVLEPEHLNWRGTIILKSLDKKGDLVTLENIDSVDFLNKDYNNKLTTCIKKALIIAQRLRNFVKAGNQEIEFCNFKTDCKLLKLKTDSLNKTISIITVDKKQIKIKFPEALVKESEDSGGISNQLFTVNSIRKIKIGTINLIVADIASGEYHNTNFIERPNNKEQYMPTTDSVYEEIIIYHGLSFDTIIRTN